MNGTRTVVALVPDPLSSGYRGALEEELGATPQYLSLAELRRRRPLDVLRMLTSLRGCFCVLPLETEDAAAVRPILETVALTTWPSQLEVVTPQLERVPVARRHVLPALSSLAAASTAGVAAVRSARRELEQLAAEPRLDVPRQPRERVLYVNANLWVGLKAGGSIGHVAGVVNGLQASGLEVDFASFAEAIGIDPGVRIHPLELPRTFGLPFEGTYYRAGRDAAAQLTGIAARANPDLIYQRMSVASYSGVVLSRRRRLPLILEYNGSEVWIAANWGRGLRFAREAQLAEYVSLRHAHLVVTVSDALRDDLLGRGVARERIVVYPNGVDLKRFSAPGLAEQAAGVRAALGIPREATVVTFVGTFGQWHGAEVLARSIVDLVDRNPSWITENRVAFVFVGDGLRMPVVREIIGGSAAEPLVRFPGLVPQLDTPAYLATSDVLVSPHVANADGTPFFGSPTKLFEYMAAGKAIIASRLDQIADVLSPSLDAAALSADDVTALAILTKPGDQTELAAALQFVLEHPERRSGLGASAQRAAAARYTWKHHVGAILDGLDAAGLRS